MNFMLSADFEPLISRNEAYEAVRKGLRKCVGRGKSHSVKSLSNASHVKDRMIECAMCEVSDPEFRPLKFEQIMSIAAVLKDEFTSAMLEPTCQGAFNLPNCEVLHAAEVAAADAMDHAELAMCASDGTFRNDGPKLQEIGLREIRRGHRLVAMGALA